MVRRRYVEYIGDDPQISSQVSFSIPFDSQFPIYPYNMCLDIYTAYSCVYIYIHETYELSL